MAGFQGVGVVLWGLNLSLSLSLSVCVCVCVSVCARESMVFMHLCMHLGRAGVGIGCLPQSLSDLFFETVSC